MAQINDFKVGNIVKHINIGKGRVCKIADGIVQVVYDTEPQRTVGKYDEAFFREYPNNLWIHDTTPGRT